MKKSLTFFTLFFIGVVFASPKPMESATNYNVLMVHGAYGSDKGITNCSENVGEAVYADRFLNRSEKDGANIGC